MGSKKPKAAAQGETERAPAGRASSEAVVLFGDEGERCGGIPTPHWCGEDPRFNETVGEMGAMVTRLATLAQSSRDESCLVAARMLHGLAAFLELPRERRNDGVHRRGMNKAASIVASHAGIPEDRFPRLLNHKNKAEEAFADVVDRALADGKDAAGIALAIEIVRGCLAHLGSKTLFPCDGIAARPSLAVHGQVCEPAAEQRRRSAARVSLFTERITNLQQNSDGGELQDPKAIVRACAHAAGFRGKLFEADRQRSRRDK